MTLYPWPAINRRQFLLSSGSIALVAAAPQASHASSVAFVTSETGTLRRVLINPASAAGHPTSIHRLDEFWQDAAADIAAQHGEMLLQLRASGAEILHLDNVLDSAIAEARRARAWTGWLSANFPELMDTHGVQAATLLAQDAGSCAPHLMDGMSYVRDFAVMLPHGLALANIIDPNRARQAALFRFMVSYAPEFRSYPIVFDAQAEGLPVEGGDLQVLDANTLLVGVGNHTASAVAPRLARAAGMDVVAVNIANADRARWPLDHDPLRDFFFHLNTVVAQVAPGQVAILPWLFEREHTGTPDEDGFLIAEFGRLSLYRAGSGFRDRSLENLKLVDYLRGRGFEITDIGGRGRHDLEVLRTEAALSGAIFPRRERQGANMLALAPGFLLAFPGADATHTTLRDEHARVIAVGKADMWRGYGGPHSLSLSMERA
jgi:arginine deiminase